MFLDVWWKTLGVGYSRCKMETKKSQVEIGWALPEHIFETRNEQNFQYPNKLLSLFEKVFGH